MHNPTRDGFRTLGPIRCVVLLAPLLAHCFGGDSSASGDVPKCTPGSTQDCSCVGGSSGVQECGADGAFGDCVCDGSVSASQDAAVRDAAVRDAATKDAGPVDAGPDSPAPVTGGDDPTKGAVYTARDAALICFAWAACMPAEFAATFADNANECINDSSGVFSYRAPGSFTAAIEGLGRTTPRLVELYQCILEAAPDCAKVAACVSPDEPSTACTALDNLTSGSSCEGTKLKGCSEDGQAFVVDCARFDQICEDPVDSFNPSYCDFPACGATDTVCEGDREMHCGASGARYLDRDCADASLLCGTSNPSGGLDCIDGDACSPMTFADTCEGTVAVNCRSNDDETVDAGQIEREDCASNGQQKRCVDGDCTWTGTDCDPDTKPTCTGTQIKLCEDGFTKSYDCTSFGFSSCTNGFCTK